VIRPRELGSRSRRRRGSRAVTRRRYGDDITHLVAGDRFLSALRAAEPDHAQALCAAVSPWCSWFGGAKACACCGRTAMRGDVYAWRGTNGFQARAVLRGEALPQPAVCGTCLGVAETEISGCGEGTLELHARLAGILDAAGLHAERAELDRVLARRPRLGGIPPCLCCGEGVGALVATPGGGLCVRCVGEALGAVAGRTCRCHSGVTWFEPDDWPDLVETDSRCFLESQFHASGYDELWTCAVCGRTWHVSIYRDGSGRNADPPVCRLLPAGHPKSWSGGPG